MNYQWDDVRIFLAVAREASMTGAANQLKMHQSTVSRRLKALEEAFGCSLVNRSSQGVGVTASGKVLWELGLEMERLARKMSDHYRKLRDAPKGVVRVTTVEEIAVQFIVPKLAEFRKRWPEVEIQINTNPIILDLNRGQADISIRLLRPQKGNLQATKLGEFGYSVFATQAYVDTLPNGWNSTLEELDWIYIDVGDIEMPEWVYIRNQIPHIKPVLRCNAFKTLVTTMQAHLGVAILPRGSSYFYPDLQRFPIHLDIPKREIWLCVAEDRSESAAIQAVCEFLTDSIIHPLQLLRAQFSGGAKS